MSSTVLSFPARPLPSWVARHAAGAEPAAERPDRLRRRAEDRRLVEAILRGEEDAFRRLVERYQKRVYWIAYDVLLDREEARDVAQETFIRVHGALDRFDPSRDFLNWLYRIARNLAIDTLRRRKRAAVPIEDLTNLPLDAPPGEAPPGPAREVAAGDLRSRVAAVLEELPVDYRLALTLREFHAMSARAIAEVTDTSYPTARWRLHRARKLFREAWERRYGVAAPGEEPR